jgi:NAD+ synthase (glutamine-hydrolysing)
MLKVALAQINPCVGDLEGNTNKIIGYLRKARQKNADIVVFPELALTGYPPEDLLLKPHFIDKNLRCLELIKNDCKDIVAVVGFIDKDKDKIYNSCALIQEQKLKDIYHKIYLPNYGVFDEKRYFDHGDSLSFCNFKNYKFSLSICEDIWKEKFVYFLRNTGLRFVINISASPFYLGKISLREKKLSSAAKEAAAFVLYCNLVGGQDELVFDGTSMIFSPQGELLKCAKRFSEDFLIFTFNEKRSYPNEEISVNEEEEAFSALSLGLYDYVKKNGFKKVIVGVSGGIDSAVVLSLAVLALGKDNVFGLIMPSHYTSKGTFNDAKKICDSLGVSHCVVDIEEMLRSYDRALKPYFKNKKQDKTEENLQARVRGNILMAFSNKFGYLVLNTGNKSELSTGYCTLYGDMVGGFGMLKDVPKMLVYKLAHYINKIMNKRIIPLSAIARAPSAELKSNQKDEDTLPPYRLLDPVLKLYVEDDNSLGNIIKMGFKRSLVKKIISMVDSSEYKRRQAPIGIKITPRAFGKDRRMPITNKFSY